MNANNISPQNDGGLNRIKRISRLVRYVVLVNLIFSVGIFIVVYSRYYLEFPKPSTGTFLTISLDILLEAFVFLWFWELARLFRFYEQGLIFAAQPIRCIKKLGIICLFGWLTMVALKFTPRIPSQFSNVPKGGTVVVVTSIPYDPFVSTPVLPGKGIDFGLLVVGACVVVAARIMEEGRKMKTEQDLPV